MISLDDLDAAERFAKLSWTIAPRPIAWVTSQDRAGTNNLAPFSFFTIACTDPLVLMLAIEPRPDGDSKDTLRNICARRQFVVHLVQADRVNEVAFTGRQSDPDFDELAALDLRTSPALKVQPPVVDGCIAVFECELETTCSFGRETLVFGRVVTSRIAAHLLTESGRITPRAVDPLGRIGTTFSRSTLLAEQTVNQALAARAGPTPAKARTRAGAAR